MALSVLKIVPPGKIDYGYEKCICNFRIKYYVIGGICSEKKIIKCPKCGHIETVYTSIK